MPKNPVVSRAICALALVLLASALSSCSGGQGGQGGSGASGGTSLSAALSHIASTSSTRSQIAYDNTAELVRLSGRAPATTKGFAVLRGWGASALAAYLEELSTDTGISLLNEDYAVTAGEPPRMVTLLHGGQSGSLVTSRLAKLGWKRSGGNGGSGQLVGPSIAGGASPKASVYALQLHVVRTTGPDVTFGGTSANLSQIGSPRGSTLATDPLVSALVSCLGDVVAAQIGIGGGLGGKNPAAVALGVAAPASNSAKPHAIACVAWSHQAGAAQYATDARKALTSGLSAATNQPFSHLLSNPSVKDIGGSQHIVQWQADMVSRADLIFQMYEERDLPALPDCTRLPPAARSRVIGCA